MWSICLSSFSPQNNITYLVLLDSGSGISVDSFHELPFRLLLYISQLINTIGGSSTVSKRHKRLNPFNFRCCNSAGSAVYLCWLFRHLHIRQGVLQDMAGINNNTDRYTDRCVRGSSLQQSYHKNRSQRIFTSVTMYSSWLGWQYDIWDGTRSF